MKSFFRYPGLVILILTVLGAACVRRSVPAKPEKAAWPTTFPCRIKDGRNLDLFLMTLGDVETTLSQGSYDPRTDDVMLNDGTVMRRYFQDTLGVKYYTPIDKSVFPLPPSGLCTWYYYYQDINEEEVKRNARWIAENLKDYGAQIVQIDDGWQKETKEGRHGSRDWTGVDKAFPGGMAALAAFIKSLGLTPGIWLAPHGQSNEEVVQNAPGVFLFKPDGTSAIGTTRSSLLTASKAPSRISLRRVNSRLGCTSYIRATDEIFIPGCSASSTIALFSSALHQRPRWTEVITFMILLFFNYNNMTTHMTINYLEANECPVETGGYFKKAVRSNVRLIINLSY